MNISETELNHILGLVEAYFNEEVTPKFPGQEADKLCQNVRELIDYLDKKLPDIHSKKEQTQVKNAVDRLEGFVVAVTKSSF